MASHGQILRKVKKILSQIESDQNQKIPVLCLTGKMAGGKNFVSSVFEECGCIAIDFDKEVHAVIEEHSLQIAQVFEPEAKARGIELFLPDGKLNRRAIGQLVFSDPVLLARQENIVFPALTESIQKKIIYIEENNPNIPAIIFNATVLYKTPDLLQLCTKIIFVKAGILKRFFRAKKRDHLSTKRILDRFAVQRSLLREYQKSGKQIVFIKN